MHPALDDLIAGYSADLRPGQTGHAGSTQEKQNPGTPQAAVLGGLAFDGPGSNPSISHPALPSGSKRHQMHTGLKRFIWEPLLLTTSEWMLSAFGLWHLFY